MRLIPLITATLAFIPVILPTTVQAMDRLDFGIIATESSQSLAKDFEPLRADLELAIALPVKLYFATDYSGVIEAMRFNKVQLGWFGNKSAIDAVDRGEGEVFCQCIDKDGNAGYWSLIIVHKESPIHSLEELIAQGKELSFSNGDPQVDFRTFDSAKFLHLTSIHSKIAACI